MGQYNLILISAVMVVAYLVTKKYRKFWNFVLLFSFLISGGLGLALAFCIDQNISTAWYSQMLWLHVETGIIMAMVSIFHTLWHLPYFKR
ncbi:MAG: hypothetical protein WC069_04935 [Candidatus Shapirobacteria bacterium]